MVEVPIAHAGREPDEGEKITGRDRLGSSGALVRNRFIRIDR